MSVSSVPIRAGMLGLLLIWGMSFSSCSSFSSDPPLPDSTFTTVLIEMHLANTRADFDTLSNAQFSNAVLAHHGVSRGDLHRTLRYYSRRPEAFEALYSTVLDSLRALQRRERRREPTSSDTLRPSGSNLR